MNKWTKRNIYLRSSIKTNVEAKEICKLSLLNPLSHWSSPQMISSTHRHFRHADAIAPLCLPSESLVYNIDP